jgi:hypothetical protein
MTEVSVHRDPAIIGLHQSILESAGIACFIRNENTSASLGAGFLGLVQSHLFDPVLCIVDDERYEEAVALLRSVVVAPTADKADWNCPYCGETVPGHFESCWNCSEDSPNAENAPIPQQNRDDL